MDRERAKEKDPVLLFIATPPAGSRKPVCVFCSKKIYSYHSHVL